MKKLITIIIAIFLSQLATAQNDLYSFSSSTRAYTNLRNATKISPSDFPDFTSEIEVTLPFSFLLYNNNTNNITLTSNGVFFETNQTSSKIAAFIALNCEFSNLDSRTTGVYTETSGTSGNRIFKIEYRRMGIYEGSRTDSTNFQIWIYEGSNNIETHYGPHNNFGLKAYNSEKGPNVGIFELDTMDLIFSTCYFLTGSPQSPVFKTEIINVQNQPSLTNHIATNTVFTFSRKNSPGVSINEKLNGQTPLFTVYPNPTKGGDLTVSIVSNNNVTYTLSDLQGKTILTKQATETNTTLATSQLAKGLYILTAQDATGVLARQKVVVE